MKIENIWNPALADKPLVIGAKPHERGVIMIYDDGGVSMKMVECGSEIKRSIQMNIFTIGYTKKSAERFFELIRTNEIDLLIDVRRYNSTQLAGFSKSRDLEYFLSQICNCEYTWAVQFAPTASLLDDYKSGKINWGEYEIRYNDLLNKQDFDFFKDFTDKRTCLLCAEDVPNFCHRRLLAERISATFPNTEVTHL